MRNIHDPNEYHKYKSTTNGNKSRSSLGLEISIPCKIVIGIVILFLISFIFDGASINAIDTLLALGFIAYLFVKWLF